MRNAATRFLAIAFLALTPALVFADDKASDTKGFTDAQKAEIQEIIKTYLTKDHPETVMQAVQELQRKENSEAQAQSEKAVTDSHDKIYKNPDTPVAGNPKGDVTVVEFFDYQCPYCKMSHKVIGQLLKDDKNVKLIYEEYPVLGPTSTSASKAALASIKQGKYLAYHNALMEAPFSHNQRPDDDDKLIYKTAKDVGLDVEKLKKDMADDSVSKTLEANLALGNDIGVRGTPMFIIGDKTYPGALQYDGLKQAVDDARKAKKTP